MATAAILKSVKRP